MSIPVCTSLIIACGVFLIGELLSKTMQYKLPPNFITMLIVIILGGQLGILTKEQFTNNGFYNMIYSFGMAILLANFGAGISVKGMKSEWRTCVIAAAAVFVIIGISAVIGIWALDMQTMLYGSVVIAGGGQAGLIFLAAANDAGNAGLSQLVLLLMSLDILIGYPVSSWAMRKSMLLRVKNNSTPNIIASAQGTIEKKKLVRVPEFLKYNFYYVFMIFGVCCLLSHYTSKLTTISAYVWYIIYGFIACQSGLLESDALHRVGAYGLIFGAMYPAIMSGWTTTNLSGVVALLPKLLLLLGIAAIACVITAIIFAKIFKTDFYEALVAAIGCMVGYPSSAKVTPECIEAVKSVIRIDEKTTANLLAYYEPKIIISGIVSISIMTGLIAGILVSFI